MAAVAKVFRRPLKQTCVLLAKVLKAPWSALATVREIRQITSMVCAAKSIAETSGSCPADLPSRFLYPRFAHNRKPRGEDILYAGNCFKIRLYRRANAQYLCYFGDH